MRNFLSVASATLLAVSTASGAFAQSNANPLLDVETGFLDGISQLGRAGSFPNGESAFSMSTTSCNPGATEAIWEAAMDPDHPFIAFMITRESGGRMVQVSDYSYVKHGFFALSSNQCNYGCAGTNGSELGIGCSDTYGVGTNGSRNWLGPATEIDPWLGDWNPLGSLFDGTPVDGNRDYNGSGLPSVDGRVRVSDADLNVSGANFYYADYYVIQQEPEANRNNNGVWRPVDFSWSGSAWNTSPGGSSSGTEGTVLAAWSGAQLNSATNGSDNGRIWVAAATTPSGSDTHYEYALHNRDNMGGIGELRIPIAPGANISNFGFHDIDGNAGNDWSAAVVGNEIVFNTGSNPVQWNTIYNFWFDADVSPVNSQITLGQFSGPGASDFTVSGVSVPGGGSIDPCTQADDGLEENDSCAAAVSLSAGTQSGLFVSKTDEDWYTVSLADGDTATLDLLFTDADGDVDVEVSDSCGGTQVVAGATGTDNEQVSWTNSTGSAQSYEVRVFVFANDASDCNNYNLDLDIQGVPPLGCNSTEDTFEENDTCGAAAAISAGVTSALQAQRQNVDPDWYEIDVPATGTISVTANFVDADGDIDMRLYDACGNEVDDSQSTSNSESVGSTNGTGSTVSYKIEVYIWNGDTGNDCNDYSLDINVTGLDPCAGDDTFEENDTCAAASTVSTGVSTGLKAKKQSNDDDWFQIDVPAGATISVDVLFNNSNGDIDADLFESCGGSSVSTGQSTNDNESLSATNSSGATISYKINVFIWQGESDECNDYDLDIDIQGGQPSNLVPFCFGDGSGTPCPCNNNSTPGHPGGCANSLGNGAVLVASGDPSIANDTLNLDLSSATQFSFGLLVSAVNPLPQTGGCIGCGVPAFDGLRCAGLDFQRHGTRATDGSGNTGNGWGFPGAPAAGLIAANGFTLGETRHFFTFYRDDMNAVCGTGQNSSNGISITMQP